MLCAEILTKGMLGRYVNFGKVTVVCEWYVFGAEHGADWECARIEPIAAQACFKSMMTRRLRALSK